MPRQVCQAVLTRVQFGNVIGMLFSAIAWGLLGKFLTINQSDKIGMANFKEIDGKVTLRYRCSLGKSSGLEIGALEIDAPVRVD